MAWIDTLLELSDAQAVSATAPSTNVVDVLADPKANETFRNVGVGDDVYVIVSVDVAPDATTGDETYQVDLETDDAEGFGTSSVIQSVTIPNDAPQYSKFVMRIPQANQRYLRTNYVLGGTTPSITVSTWITGEEPGTWYSYPDAINGFAG